VKGNIVGLDPMDSADYRQAKEALAGLAMLRLAPW